MSASVRHIRPPAWHRIPFAPRDIAAFSDKEDCDGYRRVHPRQDKEGRTKTIRDALRARRRSQGIAERDAEWNAWNQRRLEAEARGESFDEPVPGSDEDDE